MTGPRYDHLLRLGTAKGLFEHAKGANPNVPHGYCLDDVGRLLGVFAREPRPTAEFERLTQVCLAYTDAAVASDGRARNRMSASGHWRDQPFLGDHWGRAIWGLGLLASSPWVDDTISARAWAVARRALLARSPWPRASAYAAVGAAEVLQTRPDDPVARALLVDSRQLLMRPRVASGMPWPEPRLTYANPLLPEALLAIGQALDDEQCVRRGLEQLTWLMELQVHGGHLSVIPTRGWAPGEPLPAFDQQPIEVNAMAEASARAFAMTGDERWHDLTILAATWFLGDNDVGIALYDSATGAGHDGLHRNGLNRNQGAESTLAALATLQLARAVELQRA